jgi:hypothetical protein
MKQSGESRAMKKFNYYILILSCCVLLPLNSVSAQNPLIMDQFTADPSARVFEGKVYVYPSHDIPCGKGQGIIGFCMADYHVFSSENLTDWKDHGVIVSQNNVAWVDSNSYSMWAPDCINKNGKYYFYFPAICKDTTVVKGMGIGVAVSEKPYGPFIPELKPVKGVSGIDPNPFIDKDGQAYLYWASMRGLYMAKLKENMTELASEPQKVLKLPDGMKEGPYLFERNGVYYFTYPYVEKKTEKLVYAIGKNPMGPFEYAGVIMDESPTGCWTNHQSIIEYKSQWYLFYHHNDLSPWFDKNRSIRADSMFFNDDGSIRKVIPSLRGVGTTSAAKEIQIDRYSALSEQGTSVAFIDTLHRQKGWKTVLERKSAWVQYNSVDFGDKNLKSVKVKVSSENGGVVELRLDKVNGPIIAEIEIAKTTEWAVSNSALIGIPSGIHNIFVLLKEDAKIEIDWIRFE